MKIKRLFSSFSFQLILVSVLGILVAVIFADKIRLLDLYLSKIRGLGGLCLLLILPSVLLWLEVTYLFRGMVGIWRRQAKFSIDRSDKTFVISGFKEEKLPLDQIKEIKWHLIDGLESTDKDNSSFIASPSIHIILKSNEKKVYKFDIAEPHAFVGEIECAGIKVHQNAVNNF